MKFYYITVTIQNAQTAASSCLVITEAKRYKDSTTPAKDPLLPHDADRSDEQSA